MMSCSLSTLFSSRRPREMSLETDRDSSRPRNAQNMMPEIRSRESLKNRPELNTSRLPTISSPSTEPTTCSSNDLYRPQHHTHTNQQTQPTYKPTPERLDGPTESLGILFKVQITPQGQHHPTYVCDPRRWRDVVYSDLQFKLMSFIQEFVEQQLTKNIGSTITQQLQICHSAVQDLLINLQSLRHTPKLEIINFKIRRISIFLEAKQEILKLVQSDQQQTLIQWLIGEKLESSLLIELVRRQQRYVEDNLKRIIKGTFLNGEKLEEYLEENQMVDHCLSSLIAIRDEITLNRNPSRERLMNVDSIEGAIWEKILAFEKNVLAFNREIAKFIDQLYEFQSIISEQFRGFFNKNAYSKASPLKTRIEVDQIYEENMNGDALNKSYQHDYARTLGGMSKLQGEYKQDQMYRTSFPKRDNYTSTLKNRNEVSQLGLNSQLVINPSTRKEIERISRSQLAQSKPFLR